MGGEGLKCPERVSVVLCGQEKPQGLNRSKDCAALWADVFFCAMCNRERESLQAEYREIKPIFQCNSQTMVPAGEW